MPVRQWISVENMQELKSQLFSHYRKEPPAKNVHYSFMAHGEVMANQNILRKLIL